MNPLSMLFNMANPIINVNIPKAVREQADICEHVLFIIKAKGKQARVKTGNKQNMEFGSQDSGLIMQNA